MSLNIALQTATSGLRAAQAGIEIVSRNVANAGIEGYTRKTLPLESLTVNGQSIGVRLGEITRSVNTRLQGEARIGFGLTESLRVKDDFLSRLDLILGTPGGTNSLSSVLGRLGDSFRALSTTPNSSSAQSVALTRADETARSLNQLSNTVQSLRTDADASIERSVSAVNSTLKKIQDINLEIGRLRVNGQSSADLEDKRDVLVDSLSKEIDISYFTRETGEIWIMTKSGRALLDTSVHTLQYSAKPAVDPSMRYVAPPGPSGFNGIVIDGVDVTGDIGGGRIAGYVGLRDNLLVQAQDQLDEMADGLINAFSSKGLVLFFDGTAAYNPVNKIGLAQRIAVNQNVVVAPRALRHGTNAAGVVNPIPVPDPVGDATLPLAIVASFETQRTFAAAPGLATVATLEGYANAFITFQGTQRANIGDQLENQSLITNSMDQRVRNDSGVNVDQELARLIQLQSSYSASARIISAVKDMFDALMRVA